MRVLIVCAALVALSSACCYTLQSNPMAANVPVYTWYLDLVSKTAVRPTDKVSDLHAVDTRNGPALSACEMLSVEYLPMNMPQMGWMKANLSEAQRVMFTQPFVGFGPYRVGDSASSLLAHTLSDSWVRLELRCDDSPFESCVKFGFRVRQAAQSRLVIEEEPDRSLTSCIRTPSPTPSSTATPSRTPSASVTPTATPLPEYGAVFRVEATLADTVFVALQVGLNYQQLKDTSGAYGAHWCSTPVLDAQRTHVMTTLYPEDESSSSPRKQTRGHHSSTLVQWAAQTTAEREAITVTVLWSAGGFCRVSLTRDNQLDFLGCRLFVGPNVYETVTWSQISALDARAVPLCGTVVTANEPEPTHEPRPVSCDGSLGVRQDAQRSLVVVRSDTEYAEARLQWVRCSDGTERPRLERVSSLLNLATRVQTPCHIDDTTGARALCGADERVVVAIAGTTCDSIESQGLDVVAACVPASGAVLLVD